MIERSQQNLVRIRLGVVTVRMDSDDEPPLLFRDLLLFFPIFWGVDPNVPSNVPWVDPNVPWVDPNVPWVDFNVPSGLDHYARVPPLY